jgi:hypothetical protein
MDVGGDGDGVAPVRRDVVGDLRSVGPDDLEPLLLALQPRSISTTWRVITILGTLSLPRGPTRSAAGVAEHLGGGVWPRRGTAMRYVAGSFARREDLLVQASPETPCTHVGTFVSGITSDGDGVSTLALSPRPVPSLVACATDLTDGNRRLAPRQRELDPQVAVDEVPGPAVHERGCRYGREVRTLN